MSETNAAWLVILATAVVLSGCTGGESGTISRGRITAAYAAVEPLVLERDVHATNPDGSVQAVYVPVSNIVSPPFRVLLFDDQLAAEARARALDQGRVEYVQHENAILVFRELPERRRAELAAILTSL